MVEYVKRLSLRKGHRMKHAIAILALGMLAGCGEPTATPVGPSMVGITDNDVFVWRDSQTGCQYLVYAGYKRGGITPRLNPDGTQVCTQKEDGE